MFKPEGVKSSNYLFRLKKSVEYSLKFEVKERSFILL